MSKKTDGQVWLSSLDLKDANSQLKLCERTSKLWNFSIVAGHTTGTYQVLTGFYGLCDMPNKFQIKIHI